MATKSRFGKILCKLHKEWQLLLARLCARRAGGRRMRDELLHQHWSFGYDAVELSTMLLGIGLLTVLAILS